MSIYFSLIPVFLLTATPPEKRHPHRMTEIEILEDTYVAQVASVFADVVKNSVLPRWRSAAINIEDKYDDIEDNLVSVRGYNIFRRDRLHRRGGGVCVYLSEHIHAKRRTDLESDNFECLWLWLRPTRLPRPLSGIAVCVVYHPPGLPEHEHYLLNEYLTNSADILCNQYPNCGLVILGDFNDFQTANLLSRHNLKQLVQAPTRGSAILDLIITNLSNLYEAPQVLAPLGSSDHNIVTWSPDLTKSNPSLHTKSIKRLVRRYPRSCIDAFGRWATSHDWFSELGPTATVDDLATSFTSQFVQAIDRIFPLKLVKFHHSDKP